MQRHSRCRIVELLYENPNLLLGLLSSHGGGTYFFILDGKWEAQGGWALDTSIGIIWLKRYVLYTVRLVLLALTLSYKQAGT